MRKLKSMNSDRIRIFLEVARTGVRVNRQHKDIIALVRAIHCFVLRNTDYCTTSIYQRPGRSIYWERKAPFCRADEEGVDLRC